jgi:four helix bundle protein
MFRFEQLEIWQLAITYGSKIYDFANTLPKEELFGLSSQLKRAGVSVSNNIAEGSGGTTNRDFRNFLDISIKSALETVSLLQFCKGRDFISDELLVELYKEAEKLIRKINAFKKTLN